MTRTSHDPIEFKVHPSIESLDEAFLDPDSEEDARFWMDSQELIAPGQVAKKLSEAIDETSESQRGRMEVELETEKHPQLTKSKEKDPSSAVEENQVVGCFHPSSTLHISWMPKNACQFVTSVRQEVYVNLTKTRMGTTVFREEDEEVQSPICATRLVIGPKRKQNPEEDVQLLVSSDNEEGGADDSSIVEGSPFGTAADEQVSLILEDYCELNIRKLGWKPPFVDMRIWGLPKPTEEALLASDPWLRQQILQITGKSVQDWEVLHQDSTLQDPTPTIRIALFSGTEAQTDLHVVLREWPWRDPDAETLKGAVLQYRYPGVDRGLNPTTFLCVNVRPYVSIDRIERIERVHVDLGLSELSKPAYVRVRLQNVLVDQDCGYLQVSGLDDAELWSVRVNGMACTRTMEATDTTGRQRGRRSILIPLPLYGLLHQEGVGGDGSEDESTSAIASDNYEIEFSYGFMPRIVHAKAVQETVQRGDRQQHAQDQELLQVVIPGFDLPVGEYLVSAQLAKLPSDMAFGEPTGEFRTLSSSSPSLSMGQSILREKPSAHPSNVPSLPMPASTARAILYGVFMSTGQPELQIPLVSVPTPTKDVLWGEGEPNGHQHSTRSSDVGPAASATTHSMMHLAMMHAHDPQQPPLGTQMPRRGALFQSHQRHPQEAHDYYHQKQHAYATTQEVMDDDVDVSRMGASGVSRQAPSIIRPQDVQGKGKPALPRIWWKHLVVVAVSLAMVVVLRNTASFQELGLSPLVRWTTAAFGEGTWKWWSWEGSSIQPGPPPRGIEGTLHSVESTAVASAATVAGTRTGGSGLTAIHSMETVTTSGKADRGVEGEPEEQKNARGGRMTEEKVEKIQDESPS
ncbi:hypothetical protein BGZ73_006245 [Actinomortierella ambigua]|nr:hypothetical protein BGZ73_006245 [Actinomortierella ambigua]